MMNDNFYDTIRQTKLKTLVDMKTKTLVQAKGNIKLISSQLIVVRILSLPNCRDDISLQPEQCQAV